MRIVRLLHIENLVWAHQSILPIARYGIVIYFLVVTYRLVTTITVDVYIVQMALFRMHHL